MYIVIFASLVCLFLTYLDSIGLYRKGLLVSFLILTILAAIHYDYGNDYMPYYELYNRLTYYPFNYNEIIEGDYKDYGWAFLCYIFKPIGGFFTMVAVLNIIQNTIVYRFIKKQVQRSWWPLSIFIYLFITRFYLLNFSMLRQGFVVCIFLGLWTYIKDKKWWIPLIVLFLCSKVHASSMILIPFSFWGFVPSKNGKFIAIIYTILFFILFLSSNFINSVLDTVLHIEEFSEYADIYGGNENNVTFGIGYILSIIPFFFMLYYLLIINDNVSNRQMVMLSMLYFIIIPFTSVIQLISRIAIYFGVFQIAAIPWAFKSVKRHDIRILFMIIWIFWILYSYWMFFNEGVYANHYKTFHTIFEII